ncbi:MAG: dephospho-CoA kinase [Desulfobacterales bacterium]
MFPLTEERHIAPRRPLRVAVTGSAGSGKSTVCRRLQTLGAVSIDLDRLARKAVAPGSAVLEKVIERFGNGVVGDNGELNRSLLRERIICDSQARRDLEAIIHPEVLRMMDRAMDDAESAGARMIVAEVPLLFEAGLQHRFDRVVVVAAPEKVRVRRLVERDAVTPEQASALIGIQMAETEKKRRADFVIENRGNPEALTADVDRLFRLLAADPEKGGESA